MDTYQVRKYMDIVDLDVNSILALMGKIVIRGICRNCAGRFLSKEIICF